MAPQVPGVRCRGKVLGRLAKLSGRLAISGETIPTCALRIPLVETPTSTAKQTAKHLAAVRLATTQRAASQMPGSGWTRMFLGIHLALRPLIRRRTPTVVAGVETHPCLATLLACLIAQTGFRLSIEAMTPKKTIGLLVLVIALALGGFWLKRQVDIDRCLDGGGRWNHDVQSCEGVVNK